MTLDFDFPRQPDRWALLVRIAVKLLNMKNL
jgi:hypothetical protein